jgi:hypothetical protein
MTNGERWIRFLRQYGPIARNDNMYDEHIVHASRRSKIRQILFDHPQRDLVLECFDKDARPHSVVLTGTAGDGKTHLCRQVWETIGADMNVWSSDDPHVQTTWHATGQTVILHVIRDLSAWAPQQGTNWTPEQEDLLQRFSTSIFDQNPIEVFLIAANDGQLIESWRRLKDTDATMRTRELFERMLVEDLRRSNDANLTFINLSRGDSEELLARALPAFLSHEGWDECEKEGQTSEGFFGEHCPIRRNYEILRSDQFQIRLKALFQLCDYNNLHIPIRQILLLLTNALLGHPDVKDRLMLSSDISKIIRNGTVAKASVYSNVFGGNLSETRRENITVFEYLDRFRIGYETSNRIDNILIFGNADDLLRPYFDELVASDTYYGGTQSYYAAQREYVEANESDDYQVGAFLDLLVAERRRLFFTIPSDRAAELALWDLTVFRYAGEYLTRVVDALRAGKPVERGILARLVRGLNRVFLGMLVTGDREIFVASSFSFSGAKVSRLLEDRISVMPRLSERVEIVLKQDMPVLRVVLSAEVSSEMPLHLTRYEFLSRVAEGALPSSFSRECHEDILAFKTRLMSQVEERRRVYGESSPGGTLFRILSADEGGGLNEEIVEVPYD